MKGLLPHKTNRDVERPQALGVRPLLYFLYA